MTLSKFSYLSLSFVSASLALAVPFGIIPVSLAGLLPIPISFADEMKMEIDKWPPRRNALTCEMEKNYNPNKRNAKGRASWILAMLVGKRQWSVGWLLLLLNVRSFPRKSRKRMQGNRNRWQDTLAGQQVIGWPRRLSHPVTPSVFGPGDWPLACVCVCVCVSGCAATGVAIFENFLKFNKYLWVDNTKGARTHTHAAGMVAWLN